MQMPWRVGRPGTSGCGRCAVGRGGEGARCLRAVLRAVPPAEAAALSPAEAEAEAGAPSSPRPSPRAPESSEDDPAEAAAGEPEPEAGAPGSTSSEPGTPRAGRSAARAGGGSRAERCAGVHISDPYNVNLPLHITSILSVPPHIISNVSLARLTRGLECPALQPRPSPASGPCPGPGPPGEDPGQGVGLDPAAGGLMLGRGRGRGLTGLGLWVVTFACPRFKVGEPSPSQEIYGKRVSPPPEGGVVVGHRQGH